MDSKIIVQAKTSCRPSPEVIKLAKLFQTTTKGRNLNKSKINGFAVILAW